MTKREVIKASQDALDDAMTVLGDCEMPKPNNIWLPFYLGKAWAYLDAALGGEKEENP